MDGILGESYDVDIINNFKKLKVKLAEKVSAGHFKSKEKDKKVYMQLTELHNNNTTNDLLRILNHGYDTQGVKAMNKSCSAYANKGETFSKTMSLTTRLEIACSVQILGHYELWRRIYGETGLPLGKSMEKYLVRKDVNKGQRTKHSRTKLYKRNRKKEWNKKYKVLRDKQMLDVKDGTSYESGLALSQAKATVKLTNKQRNNKDTPKDQWKFPYHHHKFCTVLGHTTCRNAMCEMKGKSKEFLEHAKNEIFRDLITEQLRIDSETAGTYC